MRIALYEPSGRGGICHYTFQLAEALERAGCDVNIITTEEYELARLPRRFTITFLYKRSWVKAALTAVTRRMSRRARQQHPDASRTVTVGNEPLPRSIADQLRAARLRLLLTRETVRLWWRGTRVVHFQWLADRDSDLFFIKLLKRLGFHIVHTAHDLLPHDMRTPENRQYFKVLYDMADVLIVHADNLKKEMMEIFDIPAGKIHVVPHGSNAIFFKYDAISQETARKSLGIDSGKKVILFFGLIKPYKGLEYLLQAFEQIQAQVQNAMLLIAGRIADEDETAAQYYSQLLSEFAARNPVKCVTKYIPFERVACFFSAADLVVLPHIRPSQSGVLFSAMAAGKPVVATDAGGLAEVVENGRTGFVVPPMDAKALAEASVKILKTPGLLMTMSRESKRLAETSYGWPTVAAQTLQIYRLLDAAVPDGSWQTARS